MKHLLKLIRGAAHPYLLAVPLVMLAGIIGACLLYSIGLRSSHDAANQLRFVGDEVSAGLYTMEYGASPNAPASYRWSSGTSRIILSNPGGPLYVKLSLAAGNDRTVNVKLSTSHQRVGTIKVAATLRTYHLLLAPEPDELIHLEMVAPTFREAGGGRDLGLLFESVSVFGGGRPVPAVLISVMLGGLVLYLILLRWITPSAAGGWVLAIEIAALAWQYTLGWPLGIFGGLQVSGVAGIGLILALIRSIASTRSSHQLVAVTVPSGWWPGRRATTLWIALIVFFLWATAWTQAVVIPGLDSDFGIYLDAAARALAGDDPYQPFLIGESYVYPPPVLLIFAPMSGMALANALVEWQILSGLATIATILALYRTFARSSSRNLGRAWLLALVICFAPLWESLQIGQVNSLVLLGISLFILGQQDKNWEWLGDLGLAGAIMLKISPLLLLALPVVRGDWRRWLRVGSGLVGLSVLALPWFGLPRWADFLAIVPLLFQGSNTNPYNIALAAMGFRFGPGGALLGRVLAAGLPLLWLLGCLWWRRHDPRPLLAIGVIAMTLGSSLIWYHHLIFLAVPAVWLLLGTNDQRTALLTLLSLSLMQISRMIEFGLGWGPWFAVAGYLLLLGVAFARVRRAYRLDPL
ncbi:MAG: DUF2029 domain-containing protein [Oscillochloris sp.]|nr:DUF2029 domain-containing protein [Oscillochloris sp.]